MANIWWAYDESNSSFSALPASPLLLPVLGLFFLLAVFDSIAEKDRGKEITKLARDLKVDRVLFDSNKRRYHEMLEILKVRSFTEDEDSEMYRLAHPPWAESGEVWTY